jgi:hypothetical protein
LQGTGEAVARLSFIDHEAACEMLALVEGMSRNGAAIHVHKETHFCRFVGLFGSAVSHKAISV